MKSEDSLLKIISDATKRSIIDLEVVTPSIYSSLFLNFAKEHQVNFENEPLISQNYIYSKIQELEQYEKATSSGVNKLSASTHKAITAIKQKDDTLLSEVLQETHELKVEIEKLRESLYKDELTTVFNRKWINDTLVDPDEKRFYEGGVLALIDLNYFKRINDIYGHLVGDKVLVFVANQLKRTRQRVVRFGGDEFILFFSSKFTKDQVIDEIETLRESLLTKLIKAHEGEFRISFAFGVCAYSDGNTFEQILELADEAMYIDKKSIKKRILGIN